MLEACPALSAIPVDTRDPDAAGTATKAAFVRTNGKSAACRYAWLTRGPAGRPAASMLARAHAHDRCGDAVPP
jgi:hypothetical protein